MAAIVAVLTVTAAGIMAAQAMDVRAPPAYRFVAFGDSFTMAHQPGQGDHPSTSWATGEQASSVASRLAASGLSVDAHNAAITSSRFRDLPGQVERGPRGADLVLVFLGLNDLCWPQPTPGQRFAQDVDAGLAAVREAHPDARVVVLAVADPAQWTWAWDGRGDARAHLAGIDYCNEFFDVPLAPLDAMAGRQRLDAFDEALRTGARGHGAEFSRATSWIGFAPEDLSDADRFHPTESGQDRIADAVWAALGGS